MPRLRSKLTRLGEFKVQIGHVSLGSHIERFVKYYENNLESYVNHVHIKINLNRLSIKSCVIKKIG